MCGIAGIINKNFSPVEKAAIERITDVISHRGPDASGYFTHKNFAFGHRRLSILDLSPEGNQPMHYDNDYTITYNGEVYNYLELKDELALLGHTFKTKTDTEVILAAYKQWGTDCVKRFNGMWAFGIYDALKNIIFLSRDRFGIKPLYYINDSDRFVFGSEIKQLLSVSSKPDVNINVLSTYLVCGMIEYSNDTFFKGVHKLEQSHNLIYDLNNNEFTIQRYFDLDKTESEEKSFEYYKKKLKELLVSSVNLRLRSDVKVGTCLSGGVDSSTVATISSEINSKQSAIPFSAITASVSVSALDECGFAEKIVKKSKLDWIITKPEFEDFKNEIDNLIYAQEEPFNGPSVFLQYSVLKKCSDSNIKVLLDGQGGDELFLGYMKYIPSMFGQFRKKSLTSAIRFVKDNLSTNKDFSIFSLFVYFLGVRFPALRKTILKQQHNFLKKEINNAVNYELIDLFSKASLKSTNELQYLEIYKTNLPALLRHEDKNSMFFSVEARLPFLDYRLVQESFSVPVQFKNQNGFSKYVLRSLDLLPEEIAWRKDKLGFASPNNLWLTKLDGHMKESIFKSKIINQISDFNKLEKKYPKMNIELKWRLFNVAKWEELYNVNI